MAGYISYPLTSSAEDILATAYSYIKSLSPLWVENDGNLDTWILQVMAGEVSDLRELAQDVPDTIFRYFGESLLGFPAIDAVSATVNSTWTTTANTTGYTIPAGTQVGINDAVGNLVAFQTVVDTILPAGTTTTAAGAVLLEAIDPGADGSGLGGAGITATLLDTISWVNSITLTGATGGGLDAETATDYNDRLATHLLLLSTRPILANDFSIKALEVPGVYRAVTIDGYNPFYNALSQNQASIEVDATGWTGANCTASRSTAQAADGAASLSMAASSAATMSANSTPYTSVPCVPGQQMTGLASTRAATTARSTQVALRWLNAAGGTISETAGTAVNDTNTGWTALTATGTAPANTAYVQLIVYVITPANAEVHYADKMSLRKGSTTDWVAGGTPETGNERMVAVAAVDINGANVSSTLKTQIDNLLEANRELNFIVWEVDPARSSIDVAVTAKAITGYDIPTAAANIVAAIQAYLNPAIWGVDPAVTGSGGGQTWIDKNIVRYSEIGQVVSNADGIDYWTAITLGITGTTLVAQDITVPGPASIVSAGTVTPTVT